MSEDTEIGHNLSRALVRSIHWAIRPIYGPDTVGASMAGAAARLAAAFVLNLMHWLSGLL
jgi:hypothetical protein